MIDYLAENWLLVLIALVAAVFVAWYIFHASRRTRVTGVRRDVLDKDAAPAARNQALIDAPTAARTDADSLADPATPASAIGDSDLGRLKGVGPKLVARLHELGITRLEEIAAWTDADIDRVDSQLDRFAGRIRRDSWVEQAKLLTSGDGSAFSEKFGAIN